VPPGEEHRGVKRHIGADQHDVSAESPLPPANIMGMTAVERPWGAIKPFVFYRFF